MNEKDILIQADCRCNNEAYNAFNLIKNHIEGLHFDTPLEQTVFVSRLGDLIYFQLIANYSKRKLEERLSGEVAHS